MTPALDAGHGVSVFDKLKPQTHPDPKGEVAALKQAGARFTKGDMLDGNALAKAIIVSEADTVIHLAAEFAPEIAARKYLNLLGYK
jgi:nucleoside-diphosphate-sugar epimerase